MASARVKGLDCSIIISVDDAVEDTLTDISDFNAEIEYETLTRGYLGRLSDDIEYVYKSSKGDFSLNLHSQAWVDFIQKQIDKGQGLRPDLVFNVTGVMAFPNGDTPSMLFGDVAWGNTPLNIPARVDYVKMKLAFACSTIQLSKS